MKTHNTKKRSNRTHRVTVRLSEHLMARLEDHADKSHLTVSEYVRQTIEQNIGSDNSAVITPAAKILINDDYIMTVLSYVIGANIAQTVRLSDSEQILAKQRADEFRTALKKYL